MIVTFRPIDRWDQPETEDRIGGPFRAPYSDTVQILDRELTMLGADRVVLMVDGSERDLRRDGTGLLRDARLGSPRVRIAFDSEHGPLKYACDRYTTWQANLRAIALGLEALRKVDRYGIGTRGEQYTGYRALPPGAVALAAPMTRDEAWHVLCDLAEIEPGMARAAGPPPDGEGDLVDDAYRLAVKLHHPDVGGDPALFAQATAARDRLLETP